MKQTNKQFSRENSIFIDACGRADDNRRSKGHKQRILPTVRQASKFRRGKGTAFQYKS